MGTLREEKKLPEKIDIDNTETFYAIGLAVKRLNEIIDYLKEKENDLTKNNFGK